MTALKPYENGHFLRINGRVFVQFYLAWITLCYCYPSFFLGPVEISYLSGAVVLKFYWVVGAVQAYLLNACYACYIGPMHMIAMEVERFDLNLI